MNISNEQEASQATSSLFWGFIPVVPLAFLGLGVYRAWIEIAFVGSFVEFPFSASVRDVFDLSMAAASIVLAMSARKIVTLYNKHFVFLGAGSLLVLSTICVFSAIYLPQYAYKLGYSGAVMGGVGISFLILLYSEIYGCLNPLRVASYYSLSLVVGAIIVYIYRGFALPWLFVMTAFLPVLALIGIKQGYRLIPSNEHPLSQWTPLSIPWKAIIFMAIFAFGFGMLEPSSYQMYFGPHSSPGVFLAALAVFLGVSARGKHFNFDMVYKVGLPLMMTALLVLPIIDSPHSMWSGLSMQAGYTFQSIIIMLILSNLCYRYGASALWLFGIERALRQCCMFVGRGISDGAHAIELFGVSGDVLVSVTGAIAVLCATLLLMSERDVSSSWGIRFIESGYNHEQNGDGNPAVEAAKRFELSSTVAYIARTYKLSAREEEVLLLLAQHKSIAVIERELFIANGTAKAHVRHIYQKLNVHSRQELFEVIGKGL